MINYFAGVDVQVNRGCCYYILNEKKKFVSSGWIKEAAPDNFRKLFLQICDSDKSKIAIGIDAPREPINKPRRKSFDRRKNIWINIPEEKIGRECEVIIKSFNLANPQWTNSFEKSPGWMKLGFEIFSALQDFPFVYEVFPSASYRMLQSQNLMYELCLDHFSVGVKDMLDASVAAITVYQYKSGQGSEVGGQDGHGTIILPSKLKK